MKFQKGKLKISGFNNDAKKLKSREMGKVKGGNNRKCIGSGSTANTPRNYHS